MPGPQMVMVMWLLRLLLGLLLVAWSTRLVKGADGAVHTVAGGSLVAVSRAEKFKFEWGFSDMFTQQSI
jgi:hypothetical protein